MTKLNLRTFWETKDLWQKQGFAIPSFDYERVKKNTQNNPKWIHFGAGNIFRAFQCASLQELLNHNHEDCGLICVEGYDPEIIDKIYHTNHNNSILATLNVNGQIDYTLIASVMESLKMDRSFAQDFKRLETIFKNPSLQMASFTITEKGYTITDRKGDLLPSIEKEVNQDINQSSSYLGNVVSLLYKRYTHTHQAIALVSMDNIPHNGDVLKNAILTLANKWYDHGSVAQGFIHYLNTKVSYPCTMIDKITPRPNDGIKKRLIDLGCEKITPIITTKGTYIAPFVNAETVGYLVLEDDFPNGRPKLEHAGYIFTDKDKVEKVERMKVTTCLNPLHTALAIFGCLLGYETISQEMANNTLRHLVHQIGYVEGLPVVVDPEIIDPQAFLDEVVNTRLPNPFMPDTPQRIATDTSQKIPVRYFKTIESYIESPTLNVDDLYAIPLVLAGWIRYLMGVDDQGTPFMISSDPYLTQLTTALSDVSFGNNTHAKEAIKHILSIQDIFPIDLYQTALGERIETYFIELNQGKGSVRNALVKYLR